MGRIGKKKKPTGAKVEAAASENYTKKLNQAAISSLPGQGFNENDIEFMKKAI